MNPTIHLENPDAGEGNPRRLNLFPGRSMSEREFALLQAYVDDRIGPLSSRLDPGILSGLEASLEHADGDAAIVTIQPGIAVGAGGAMVRLAARLELPWSQLAEDVERGQDLMPLPDGIYFLTVQSAVREMDAPTRSDPWTREETDPLRDRRIETTVIAGLQLVTASPGLLKLSPAGAANRICVRCLESTPFLPETGAVPVALMKIAGRSVAWFDTVAGRFPSGPGSAYRTFQAHSLSVWNAFLVNQPNPPPAAFPALSQLLDIGYLPAAGPFPSLLVRDIAGRSPGLNFPPGDLQADMIPIPAGTAESVVASELNRGTVDLARGRGDRIRILIAVDDMDYRPDLLDWPERDLGLEDEMRVREGAANRAWSAWRSAWHGLYGGLNDENLLRFKAQALQARPPSAEDWRKELLVIRRNEMGENGKVLPEPWASHSTSPHTLPDADMGPEPDLGEPGLHAQRLDKRNSLREIEAGLNGGYQLLNEVNDFLGLQRQQLDSLTISFSNLAGGVAGDGKGLDLLRWLPSANFVSNLSEEAKP